VDGLGLQLRPKRRDGPAAAALYDWWAAAPPPPGPSWTAREALHAGRTRGTLHAGPARLLSAPLLPAAPLRLHCVLQASRAATHARRRHMPRRRHHHLTSSFHPPPPPHPPRSDFRPIPSEELEAAEEVYAELLEEVLERWGTCAAVCLSLKCRRGGGCVWCVGQGWVGEHGTLLVEERGAVELSFRFFLWKGGGGKG
jgi:hypothetical protein